MHLLGCERGRRSTVAPCFSHTALVWSLDFESAMISSEMGVCLLAEALEHDVEFIGVVDGGDEDRRFVRRSVFLEKNGNRLRGLAHVTGDTPAS